MVENRTTPEALVIVTDESGNFWRIWPDLGAWPIKSHPIASDWDRLLDWRALYDLKPSMSLAAMIAGSVWTRVRYSRCVECDGTGEDRSRSIVTDADGRGNVEHGHPECGWCNGEGWRPNFAEQVRASDVLGRLAA